MRVYVNNHFIAVSCRARTERQKLRAKVNVHITIQSEYSHVNSIVQY